MIVVDTTVWIAFLEAKSTGFDRHLTELVENDAPIALVDIVYCKVLQGILDEDAFMKTFPMRGFLVAGPGVQRQDGRATGT